MTNIIFKTVDFKSHINEIRGIRTTVFIKEQNVPEKLEWDEFDADSIHFIAYYNNIAVGTARLLNTGHIGRMAILKNYRNRNIGKDLLKYVLKIAKTKSFLSIQLSAQEHAVEFYKKQGFRVTSKVYIDAGIPHYDMKYIKHNHGDER